MKLIRMNRESEPLTLAARVGIRVVLAISALFAVGSG
jgi:hypothetical protein